METDRVVRKRSFMPFIFLSNSRISIAVEDDARASQSCDVIATRDLDPSGGQSVRITPKSTTSNPGESAV